MEGIKVDDRVAIPKGSLMQGSITQVRRGGNNAGDAEIRAALDEARLEDGTSLDLPSSFVTMKKEGTRAPSGSVGVLGAPKSRGSGLGPLLIPNRTSGIWGAGKKDSRGWETATAAATTATQIMLNHGQGVLTPPWQETLPLPSLPPRPPNRRVPESPTASSTPEFDIPAGGVFEARF